jgi:hypothetical protein
MSMSSYGNQGRASVPRAAQVAMAPRPPRRAAGAARAAKKAQGPHKAAKAARAPPPDPYELLWQPGPP